MSRYKIAINLISLAAIALKFVSYLNRFLSFQGYEEMEIEEHHGYRAPLGFNKSKRYLMEGDATAGPSQVRMPVFWDVQNPVGRSGKRKISWQHQLALRV